jgi:Flp pilus assembly protein TadG
MQYKSQSTSHRRGAVAPLTAILIVFILGMVAFAVDMGYIVQTKEELESAADSAAMAGAGKLRDYEVQYYFSANKPAFATTASNSATSEAQKFGQKNNGGGVNLVVNTSDISVGYLASPPWQNSFQSTPANSMPNCVQVTTRRDRNVSTGSLALFFAPVLGISTIDLQAKATATCWGGSKAIGFKGQTNGPNSLLLPIALDVNAWNAFLSSSSMPPGYTSQDNYTVTSPTPSNPSPGNVTSGADGIPEMVGIYPNVNAPGNWGLIDIGPDTNSAPSFWNWITNGPSPADLQFLAQNRNGVPGSSAWQATPSSPATLKCGPGLKASDESYLKGIIGQPRIMPIFSACTGVGQNATYTIVGFAGVTLVDAVLTGGNKHITIQPITAMDQTAVISQTTSAGSTFVYGYGSISLTK